MGKKVEHKSTHTEITQDNGHTTKQSQNTSGGGNIRISREGDYSNHHATIRHEDGSKTHVDLRSFAEKLQERMENE